MVKQTKYLQLFTIIARTSITSCSGQAVQFLINRKTNYIMNDETHFHYERWENQQNEWKEYGSDKMYHGLHQ